MRMRASTTLIFSGLALSLSLSWIASASAQTTVANGGTGRTSLNAGGVMFGNGTTPVGTAVGTSGQLLQSNGAAAPTWVTATNANTASAVVKRDASGNFSAGTITATLSGRASTATALAANGTDCAAGQFARGVDASGNAQLCTTIASTETDPQVGTIATNRVPTWNGTALVSGSITDSGSAVSIAGPVSMPSQSFVTASRANMTTAFGFTDSNGPGTGSTIDFDNEQVDARGEFNPSTDTFVAQAAGSYQVCAGLTLHAFTPLPPGTLGYDVTSMTIYNVTGAAVLRVLDLVSTGDPSAQVFQYHLGGCSAVTLTAGQSIQIRVARPAGQTAIADLFPLTANDSIWLTISRIK